MNTTAEVRRAERLLRDGDLAFSQEVWVAMALWILHYREAVSFVKDCFSAGAARFDHDVRSRLENITLNSFEKMCLDLRDAEGDQAQVKVIGLSCTRLLHRIEEVSTLAVKAQLLALDSGVRALKKTLEDSSDFRSSNSVRFASPADVTKMLDNVSNISKNLGSDLEPFDEESSALHMDWQSYLLRRLNLLRRACTARTELENWLSSEPLEV